VALLGGPSTSPLDAAVRHVSLFALLVLIGSPSAASAEDATANFLMRLFIDVCIPNVGHPEKVRAWAVDKSLQVVTSPIALELFVGRGVMGPAWTVPSSIGSFALSIRGTSKACAVWARQSNPADVEVLFRKILEGVARPGVEVAVDRDTREDSPFGTVHTLIYSVTGENKLNGGFMYTMQTVERSGGGFQASLQAARFSVP
jgi:hypothetical protein